MSKEKSGIVGCSEKVRKWWVIGLIDAGTCLGAAADAEGSAMRGTVLPMAHVRLEKRCVQYIRKYYDRGGF